MTALSEKAKDVLRLIKREIVAVVHLFFIALGVAANSYFVSLLNSKLSGFFSISIFNSWETTTIFVISISFYLLPNTYDRIQREEVGSLLVLAALVFQEGFKWPSQIIPDLIEEIKSKF